MLLCQSTLGSTNTLYFALSVAHMIAGQLFAYVSMHTLSHGGQWCLQSDDPRGEGAVDSQPSPRQED